MKKRTGKAEVKKAFGKVLPEAIKFPFGWEDFESFPELVEQKKTLTDKEQVKARNRDTKNNARQKALTAILEKLVEDGVVIRPTLENDPQMRLRKMRDIFIANGSTEDEAREEASERLKIEWEDEDE